MERDDVVLGDIINAADEIVSFVEGMTEADFIADSKTRSAVLYQLLVIGEAVKRLSPPFKGSMADIPWRLIAGMRDHLIHGYDVIDWDEVWHTATVDIPELLRKLESRY